MVSRLPSRILHVDGDTFFASCEVALDASLSGKPVWVGGGRRGDGIVIAANREAILIEVDSTGPVFFGLSEGDVIPVPAIEADAPGGAGH